MTDHRSPSCGRARAVELVGALLIALAPITIPAGEGDDEDRDRAPRDPAPRVAWTASRLVGSPDPPLPYTVERFAPGVRFRDPLYALAEPGGAGIFVVEQGGERERPSRIVRIPDEDEASDADRIVVLEVDERLVYSLAFHPDFAANAQVFVFSNGPTPEPRRFNRVTRYTVDRARGGHFDAGLARIIIEWESAGHDGGDLAFGADGMLYVSSGDGTSDSDTLLTAQDIGDLRGGVLRIDVNPPDVDRPDEGLGYSIPDDNPFVAIDGARGELWAYGLRNPWRMSFDSASGQLWVGNNGQDLWETAHLVRGGENFGWSVYEGRHPFYAGRALGPTPVTPPALEHHHREARSLTGGVVYRGERLAELDGVYVYGDYATGKIWGARHNGDALTYHRELADTSLAIAGFALSSRGDLIVVGHREGLHRLVRAEPPPEVAAPFPRLLSETGLFASVRDHAVAPGVIPYAINAPAWTDGAGAERFVALPDGASMSFAPARGFEFSGDGAAIAETLSLGLRRIETRVLLRDRGEWAGYSYVWNDEQSNAELAGADGADIEIPIDGERRPWRVPSRAECLSCHSRAANFVLGLSGIQLRRGGDADGDTDAEGGADRSPLDRLASLGVLSGADTRGARLVDPYDASLDLDARARSYLHVNCSCCHVEAGGGNARMELGFDRDSAAMRLIGARPQHQIFGLAGAMLVAPGEPERSVLIARVARRGPGQMPPLGTARADEAAVELLREWIAAMPRAKRVREWTLEELVAGAPRIAGGRDFAAGERAYRDAGCRECHRIAGDGGGAGPDLSRVGREQSVEQILESIVEPSRRIATEYATAVIVTKRGVILDGRIGREDGESITLWPSGAFAEPLVIPARDIARRAISSASPMPSGALDVLELDEILDLVAYVVAGAQREHPAFGAGGGDED